MGFFNFLTAVYRHLLLRGWYRWAHWRVMKRSNHPLTNEDTYMKCRYYDATNLRYITVSAPRTGVISLCKSLCFNPNVTDFSICCQAGEAGEVYWLMLWTRQETEEHVISSIDGGVPVLTPILFDSSLSLSVLDCEVVNKVAEFIQNRLYVTQNLLNDVIERSGSGNELTEAWRLQDVIRNRKAGR